MNSIQIITRESFGGLLVIGVWLLFCFMIDCSLGLLVGILALIAWVWAYRNPERIPLERGEDIVLAPIDGRVSNIEQLKNGVRISIEVGFFDTGLVRSPQATQDITLEKKSGLVAQFSPLKKRLNETLSAISNSKSHYKIRLFPRVFKHSRFYAPIAFRAGERMGFMKVGMLELEVDSPLELRAHIGDRLKGGTSVIGYAK